MDDSDSSSLSSAPPTDDELAIKMNKPTGLDRYFKPAPKPQPIREPSSPPPPKRAPSPPHEYVFADSPDIAFIVMFRSRFSAAFPKSLPHYGPQDIEMGLEDVVPGEHVERLLCALLGLVLNRKKDVERGHYGRALEEAIQTHSSQWPAAWKGANPLHGGGSFYNMTPEQRLILLKTLILWALSGSDAIQAIIKQSYKQSRHEDDRNQPLSVQPWGKDGYKRNYWLIEGQDDTHFRLYRENNGSTSKTNTWFNVSGTIEEIVMLADKLNDENTPHSRTLRDKIKAAIPRFEAGEDVSFKTRFGDSTDFAKKRKRRDYRLARKAAFARPEPGFSMYEGRTRGKRMRYTFSDEEDDSDTLSNRRSTRQSGVSTPAEVAGPTITASGRQVRSRLGGMYGESILIDQRKERENELCVLTDGTMETDDEVASSNGHPQRSARQLKPSRLRESFGSDSGTDEEESEAEAEWSGDEDEPDEPDPDFGDEEDEDMSGDESEGDEVDDDDNTQESLVVQLRYKKGGSAASNASKSSPLQHTSTEQHERGDYETSLDTDRSSMPGDTAATTPLLNGEISGQFSERCRIEGGLTGNMPVSTALQQPEAMQL